MPATREDCLSEIWVNVGACFGGADTKCDRVVERHVATTSLGLGSRLSLLGQERGNRLQRPCRHLVETQLLTDFEALLLREPCQVAGPRSPSLVFDRFELGTFLA